MALTKDRQWLPSESLINERRHHAAIVYSVSWTVSIENTDYTNIEAMHPVVGHGNRLGIAFGFIIDTTRTDRIDIAPVFLRLRMDQRIAVDLGSRGQQELCSLGLGEAKRVVSAQSPDLERRDRQLKIVNRPPGLQMEDQSTFRDVYVLANVVVNELESRVDR